MVCRGFEQLDSPFSPALLLANYYFSCSRLLQGAPLLPADHLRLQGSCSCVLLFFTLSLSLFPSPSSPPLLPHCCDRRLRVLPATALFVDWYRGLIFRETLFLSSSSRRSFPPSVCWAFLIAWWMWHITIATYLQRCSFFSVGSSPFYPSRL